MPSNKKLSLPAAFGATFVMSQASMLQASAFGLTIQFTDLYVFLTPFTTLI